MSSPVEAMDKPQPKDNITQCQTMKPAEETDDGKAAEDLQIGDAGGEHTPRISILRLSLVLAVLWTSLVFPILDETMIATLLGPISTSFNALSNLSWIATTYLIGMSAANPISGHLADIFGRRNSLIVINAFFIIGTLICGVSPRLWVLLLGRSIEGFGGGAMQSITAVIESDLVPLRNRGITEGLGGIVYGVAIAVGGLYGGGINDSIGWKWAFLTQVPIVTVLSVVVWFLVRIPTGKSETSGLLQVDYVGAISIVAAMVFLQLGLQSGGNTRSWTSSLVLVSLPLAAACFSVFVVWDLKFAKEPVVPIRLLGQRNLFLSCVFYFFALMSYFTVEFYVPIYLQMLGHSTTATGLRFIPQAAGAAFATLVVGMGVKWTGEYYWSNVIVQMFAILGSGLLLALKTTSPSWYPFVFLAFTGVGFGGSWVTILMGVLSSVTDKQQATVQSAGYCVRSVGMTAGLTVATAVFQKVLKSSLQSALGRKTGGEALIQMLRSDFHAVQSLDPEMKSLAQGAYMDALHVVFWVTTAEIIIAALSSLFMKANKIPESLIG